MAPTSRPRNSNGGKKPGNADEAVTLSQKANGASVLLRVWTKGSDGSGGTHYVVIENSKKTAE